MSLSEYFGISVDYLLKGNAENVNDMLSSVLKDFSPLQREALANAIMLIRLGNS